MWDEDGSISRMKIVRLRARFNAKEDKSTTIVFHGNGGFMGDGFEAEPGKMQESIFQLPLCLENGEMPSADPSDWSEENVFARHAFATLRVRVDAQLRPCSEEGSVLLDNVRFVGRSLGGYDFATEKSGNGVALATAWYAAQCV